MRAMSGSFGLAWLPRTRVGRFLTTWCAISLFSPGEGAGSRHRRLARPGRLRSPHGGCLGARDGGRAAAAFGTARPRPGPAPPAARRAAAGLRAVSAGPPAGAGLLGGSLASLAGLRAAV